MKYAKVVCLQFFLIITFLPATIVRAQDDWVVQIVNRGLPAVVSVVPFNAKGEKIGVGSGYVIGANGLIATNYHVISGASQAKVYTRAGDVYRVEGVLDFDRDKDFAILKIQAYDLPKVLLGNSNQVQIGEPVVAIGSPLSLDGTVSTGIVSSVRKLESFSMLQTTAAISPGSSGGPLFNRRGEVIGMVTMQMKEGQNLNFALPINYVRGALQPGQTVKYSLARLAVAEVKLREEKDDEEQAEFIRETFARYEDPDRKFSLVTFKNWRVTQHRYWSDDRQTLHLITVIAPAEARLAEANGYVSEGIRIHLRVPPSGRVWTQRTLEAWPEEIAQGLLRANPGFARTDARVVNLNGTQARMFAFVGQDKRLPETEKTVLYTFGAPEAFATVELIAPTSKLKLLDALETLMKTFQLAVK
ncbi:MAG: S1C family serine protease [Acidobacteriota bacterium]